MCKKYDSGYPRLKIFDVTGQDENVFSKLLTFDLESRNSIIQVYDDIKDRLPNESWITNSGILGAWGGKHRGSNTSCLLNIYRIAC